MPEKALWTQHVGMEALNSVGSTGSCDSMESISSNHSAFSGDGYDHLSAEERECLMFLEETIDSLDNENDSGLSNDEQEREKTAILSVSEPMRIPQSNSNEETPPKITTLSKSEEWPNVALESNRIPHGYHSFPRIIQGSRDETTKHPTDSKLADSNKDPTKLWHGKPKSVSSLSQQHRGESPISEFLILPPPEPFRDPQVVDKRRSVTDPTDSREVRFYRGQQRAAKISEHTEAPPVLKPPSVKAPTQSLFPRVTPPSKTLTGSQQSLNQVVEKPVDFQLRQGPPTAPKPRTLPPHIIIKTSGGAVSSLDPQKRPRTFSAHERSTDKANVPHSKEQEQARHEALQKLGLEDKSSSHENISFRSSKIDLSSAQGISDQSQKDSSKKSVVLNQQERLDFTGSTPVQPSIVVHKPQENIKNEGPTKNKLSMKSNSYEKSDEPVGGTAMFVAKDTNVDVNPLHNIKSGPIVINRQNVKANTQEESEVVIRPSQSLNEIHMVADSSQKHMNSDVNRNSSFVKPFIQSKADNVIDKPGHTSKEASFRSDVSSKNKKEDIGIKPSSVKTHAGRGITVPEMNPIPVKTSDHLTKFEKLQEKVGSLENINLISTSPGKTFSFPRPKEVSVTPQSPEVIQRDGKDKVVSRHSTHFEPATEPYLRFPQGSVPGLRQINIKSNTLERSGVGLSDSIANTEKEAQKGGNSFFKKPLFSGNFLRNNRQRPASLGTGQDFAGLESSTLDADNTEKRSFFSRPTRSSAPVTSVKITPKGSTDETRKEALKKLGILKE
ncbi:specifically androgen-regulated gene protein [Mixophyes fleayi]|uniref:specifically androgen-regulated gene protein n=1 Tax=Mixophyes fleayi TaxID=3061075 RepID=UPI003F4DB10D